MSVYFVVFIPFVCFLLEILSANSVDADQTPHNVASDLDMQCLSMKFYGFPGNNWLLTLTCPTQQMG